MGLLLDVYRNDGADCTNGGVSSKSNRVCVVNVDGPFFSDYTNPAVMLEAGPCNSIRLVPSRKDAFGNNVPIEGVRMFGGNYAATSDSRFGEACARLLGHPWYGAVAIHDRFEGRSHE